MILHACEPTSGFFIHIAKKKSYCTFASPQVVFSTHTREEKSDITKLEDHK
jgi:hypothetical protein